MPVDAIARENELRVAVTVLDSLPEGPAALIVEGEPGIGKTTLWRAVVEHAAARGITVLQARPAESETGLPFGALADLLRDVGDDVLAALPSPQRCALAVALLRAEPTRGESSPVAVPAAFLTLLRELARRGPVLLALDDVQWLDASSSAAIAYAARRLGTSPVGILAAVRTPLDAPVLALDTAVPESRLRRVRLGPLAAAALHDLFHARLGHSLPRPVLVRVAAASAGNPFHALEIARELDANGGCEAGAPLPVPAAIRDVARDRVQRLPASARRALLRVAALRRPTTALVDAAALEPAEVEGVVEIRRDGRIAFAHPLFADAVYAHAGTAERRAIHRELAAIVPDLEERARHAALAATGPDGAVAQLVTEAAARARARGATSAAAELVELAIGLTPPEALDDRFRRDVRLAQDLSLAGQPEDAERRLEGAIRVAPVGDARDEALIALSLIRRETHTGRAVEACEEALERASSPAIVARAHATLGLLLESVDVPRAAEHSGAAAARFEELGDRAGWSYAVLGHAWHELLLGQPPDDAAFERGVAAQAETAATGRWRSAVPQAWALAHDDFATARRRFTRALERARGEGHESDVALLQAVVAQVDAWRGDATAADAGIAEALAIARVAGSPATLADVLRIRANIDALRGRHECAREALGPQLAALERPDEGRFVYATASILGFVAWSAGDAAEADAQFSRATRALDAIGVRELPGYRYLGDHVEAILALGDVDRADAVVSGLEQRAVVFPRPWSVAVAARCRALILAARGDLDGALRAVEAAVAAHDRLESPYELGRTLLTKAHLHRRRTEKRLARDTLEAAVDALDAAGAEHWAARARSELERIRFRTTPTELTATELQIAALAAAGRTNREIAGTVFLSPKTVETRLASAYGKLGIRSRAELGASMAARGLASVAGLRALTLARPN